MGTKIEIDWAGVSNEYRLGMRSLRDIAKEFNCSDAGIIKRAKKEGWVRDLGIRTRASADAKISEDALQGQSKPATERNLIEANATLQVAIRRGQRTDIARARTLAMVLLGELEAQSNETEVFKDLGRLIENGDQGNERLSSAYQKVLSLSHRTGIMKSLADAIKTLMSLESDAFGITPKYEEPIAPVQGPVNTIEAARQIAFLFATAMNKGK